MDRLIRVTGEWLYIDYSPFFKNNMTADIIVSVGGLITAVGGVIALLIKTANDNRKSNEKNETSNLLLHEQVKTSLIELTVSLREEIQASIKESIDDLKQNHCGEIHKAEQLSKSDSIVYDNCRVVKTVGNFDTVFILQPSTVKTPEYVYIQYETPDTAFKGVKPLTLAIDHVGEDFMNMKNTEFLYIDNIQKNVDNEVIQGICSRAQIRCAYIQRLQNMEGKYVGSMIAARVTPRPNDNIAEIKDLMHNKGIKIQDILREHKIDRTTTLL